MGKIKSIFERIKNYLNNIFNRKNLKLIEANTRVIQNESKSDEIYEEQIDKEEFFIIYKNLKSGKIKITDLMINDLIKVQLMMQNEMDLYDSKLDVLEDEIADLNTEKNILIKENEMYLKKIQ